jgi:hypothetical protein
MAFQKNIRPFTLIRPSATFSLREKEPSAAAEEPPAAEESPAQDDSSAGEAPAKVAE